MFRLKALFPLLFFVTGLHAQNVYHFTKGLMVSSGSRYGREAIYTDQLAWKLYQKNLQAPTAGGVFGTNEKGDTLKWKAMQADSSGAFKNNFRRNGGGNPFGNPGSVDRGADYLYLEYISPKEQTAVLNIKGHSGVYVNGAPHMGDPYGSGWLYIPVKLKKGLNEFFVRGINVTADLMFPQQPVYVNTEDATLPDVVLQMQNGVLKGAVVVINSSSKELKNFQLKSSLAGKELITALPSVPAMSTRKIIFDFDASAITAKGKFDCALTLIAGGKTIDTKTIQPEAVDSTRQYKTTFVSNIDGSLQYYAVTPQLGGNTKNAALFLSVHGAGVEAIGQAKAYHSKDWGTLVAATNRRPRGFNWEDWGRLDALEVLNLGEEKFNPDPQHIYLTGHSMGGHGTWFLGVTYPDKWAAIGACSGYPTLKEYGSADGKIPDSSKSPVEQMLLRAGNQSDVLKLVSNYKPLGIYILHGDSDKVVPVMYARQMRKALGEFHPDFSYHEYPGGEHWFGDQSVDWKPMFDFFKWHTLLPDSATNRIDFMTSSPGISSSFRWASVIQQIYPLQYSRIQLLRNKKANTITGSTQNVLLLKLALNEFGRNTSLNITLDSTGSIPYTTKSGDDSIYLVKQSGGNWVVGSRPEASQKNPQRYGTFKEAFNNNMVFIYSTKGTKEENEAYYNKVLYDAETWYYRGNGAMDIIADKDFVPAKYKGRNLIIYGNATTNAAWNLLLKNCPIQIERNTVKAGDATWSGDDLGAYLVWPQADDVTLSVGVVAGTGVKGINAASANQYFAGASGFPDFMVFKLDMLKTGANDVKMSGFYDNNWQLSPANFVQSK